MAVGIELPLWYPQRTSTQVQAPHHHKSCKEKPFGEKYVWFLIGCYPHNWYKVKDNHHICIVEQLEEALESHLFQRVYHTAPGHKHDRIWNCKWSGTTQQFTEPLDRMLNKSDSSLISSQANPRAL
ncbi:hypothetical protein RRG08_032992 [Elysia crispata]|uniref:Uncharacterized protein n=1 Tax=Elysia crispata TaxID=231223 RepID=A0AAE1D3H3_9GAST|nr:hypothetical protein RRG08_032992 [Elysia crispata]